MCLSAELAVIALAHRVGDEVRASNEGLGDGDWMLVWDLASEEVGPVDEDSDHDMWCAHEAAMYELIQQFERVALGDVRDEDYVRVSHSLWVLEPAEQNAVLGHLRTCMTYAIAA